MIQYRHQEISNERLVLDRKLELYYLGHDLTLRNCTVVIKVPERALVIARTRFIDCIIEVKRVLKNFRWYHAHLEGCRFSGRFSGNDFGSWPETPEEGSLKDCDFSLAQLDGCRFIQCDVRTLRFPSWPCFTLIDPIRRWRELSALKWPGEMSRMVEGFAERLPETSAATYCAIEVSRSYGTTPDAIKAVLETLNGVYY